MFNTGGLFVLSGKIVYVDLDGKGNEQRGIHRAIILKFIQGTALAIVVPLTSKVDVFSKFGMTHYIRQSLENGLTTDSVAQVFQINSCSTARFQRDPSSGEIKVIGTLSDDDKKAIDHQRTDEIPIKFF
jgi:mRNA-degrading endonuclease toxin of MazEF toxin-antitoxin module